MTDEAVLHDLRIVYASHIRLRAEWGLQQVRLSRLLTIGRDANWVRLVPNHIAGFAVMYGIFLAFGVSLHCNVKDQL